MKKPIFNQSERNYIKLNKLSFVKDSIITNRYYLLLAIKKFKKSILDKILNCKLLKLILCKK